MSGAAQSNGPPSERSRSRLGLLGLAGIGLFLAGGILGAILTTAVTLYRTLPGPAAPTPDTILAATALPPETSPPRATPTAPPAASSIPIGPAVGQQAPAFSLLDLEGTEHTLEAYRGRLVLINFWASWCPPCRQEWPELQRFAAQPSARVILLAVNVQESSDVVRDLIGDDESPFPVLLDRDGSVSQQYRVTALPTTFLLDQHGLVRQVIPGNLTAEDLTHLLDNYLEP